MEAFQVASKRAIIKCPICRALIYYYQRRRLSRLLPRIISILEDLECKTVLDLGPNTCVMSDLLSSRGYRVEGLDVFNWSVVPTVSPVIYDGCRFPFSADRFDCGLVISMLHHTSNSEELIAELRRTCKFIILQEDLVTTSQRRIWLSFLDSLVNFEWFGHPRSYRSDEQWREVFARAGLQCLSRTYFRYQGVDFGFYLLRSV